jgi:hypothetical protein
VNHLQQYTIKWSVFTVSAIISGSVLCWIRIRIIRLNGSCPEEIVRGRVNFHGYLYVETKWLVHEQYLLESMPFRAWPGNQGKRNGKTVAVYGAGYQYHSTACALCQLEAVILTLCISVSLWGYSENNKDTWALPKTSGFNFSGTN